MPSQPPRSWSVLVSTLAAAGIVFSVTGCGHVTPLGPDAAPAATPSGPAPPLRSPFVLEAVRIQPPTSRGGCRAGSVAISGGPGQCYRELGAPVRVATAFVGPVVTDTPAIPPGVYGFWVTLPAADLSALHTLTTAATDAQGFLDVSAAGQTWLLPRVRRAFVGPLEMVLPNRNEVLQLHRLLLPAPQPVQTQRVVGGPTP